MNSSTSRSRRMVPTTRASGPMTIRGLRLFFQPQPPGSSTMMSPWTTDPRFNVMSPDTVDTSPPMFAPVNDISPLTLLTSSATSVPSPSVILPFTTSISPLTLTFSASRIEPLTLPMSSAVTPDASRMLPFTVSASSIREFSPTRIVPFTVSSEPLMVESEPTEMLPFTVDSPPVSVLSPMEMLLLTFAQAGATRKKASTPAPNGASFSFCIMNESSKMRVFAFL